MDNIVGLKRKAQKLVQRGAYQEAIEHYVKVVESGDMDPYDYVVLGDLLLRVENKEEAVDRYQQALDSYVTGGLYRNAIALCKRIRRLVPHRMSVQRQLGDLYAAEGLNTEAALHYIEYLERARGTEEFEENAEEVCRNLLEFPLPTFDLVPRLVDIAREVEAEEAMAPGVLFQAKRAEDGGNADHASSLRALAEELDPDAVMATPGDAPAAGPMVEPGAVSLDETPADEPSASPEPAAPGGIAFDDGPGVVDLDGAMDEPEPLGLDDATPTAAVPEPGALSLDDTTPDADGAFSLDEAAPDADGAFSLDEAAPDSDGAFSLDEAAPGSDGAFSLDETGSGDSYGTGTVDAASDAEADLLREKADAALSRGDSGLAQREYMRAGRAYAAAGHAEQASEVYRSVVKLDPNHLDALEALVGVARETGNTQNMIRFGCDLGDVLLARERYDEARARYERVLEVDPDNQKARSRVKRLADMSGESAADGDEADEGSSAVVEVRDDAGAAPTQTSVDLAAILEEFKASIVDSIPTDDAQSHYDMGMAYKEMGLVDEAVAEYHSASESPELRPRALEMLGECYLIQARHEDALLVLEELAGGNAAPESEARVRLALGKAMEGLNRLAEAEENYFRALELNEDLVEAAERLHELEQKRAGGAS